MTVAPTRPYQVCLRVGASTAVLPNMRNFELTPAHPDVESVLAALTSSGLAPDDLRSKVLFVVPDSTEPNSIRSALLMYTAVCGFAGRRVDIACGGTLLTVAELNDLARALPDAGRPDPVLQQVQIGAVHSALPSIMLPASPTEEHVSAIRFARRIRLVPSAGMLAALIELIWVAAVRQRGDNERWPALCDGTEPAETPVPDEPEVAPTPADDLSLPGDSAESTEGAAVVATPPSATPGIDLDLLRRESILLRRTLRRVDGRDHLVEALEPTQRQLVLQSAAALDIATVLTRLGTTADPSTGLWHCPRPERHTNGDSTASMRVQRNTAQCFRCDAERSDPLRLTMDALGLTVDEAAHWLAGPSIRADRFTGPLTLLAPA